MALALTVTDFYSIKCVKRSRTKERTSDARSKTKRIHLLWGYVMMPNKTKLFRRGGGGGVIGIDIISIPSFIIFLASLI